jgi:TonB family protein
MWAKSMAIASILGVLAAIPIAKAQSEAANPRIVTVRLGPDQVGVVKTAERLSTRISFREPVREIICGDLYDPSSGTGAFVIQRIDNDVFIKPVAPRGISNMFIKVGEKGERIYNFSLVIAPFDQAYYIVKVLSTSENVADTRRPIKFEPPAVPLLAIPSTALLNGRLGAPIAIPTAGVPTTSPEASEVDEPPPPPGIGDASRNVLRSVVKRVPADYPDVARAAGATGDVIVEVTIDKKGSVTSARAVSGHPLLREAAASAARLWKFSPADPRNASGLDTVRITFRFQPADRGSIGKNDNERT